MVYIRKGIEHIYVWVPRSADPVKARIWAAFTSEAGCKSRVRNAPRNAIKPQKR